MTQEHLEIDIKIRFTYPYLASVIEYGNNIKSNKTEHLCHHLQFYSERFPDFTKYKFTASM